MEPRVPAVSAVQHSGGPPVLLPPLRRHHASVRLRSKGIRHHRYGVTHHQRRDLSHQHVAPVPDGICLKIFAAPGDRRAGDQPAQGRHELRAHSARGPRARYPGHPAVPSGEIGGAKQDGLVTLSSMEENLLTDRKTIKSTISDMNYFSARSASSGAAPFLLLPMVNYLRALVLALKLSFFLTLLMLTHLYSLL